MKWALTPTDSESKSSKSKMSDFIPSNERRLDQPSVAMASDNAKTPGFRESQWSSEEMRQNENDEKQQYKENETPAGAASVKHIANTHQNHCSIRQQQAFFTPFSNHLSRNGQDTASVAPRRVFREKGLPEPASPSSLLIGETLAQDEFCDFGDEEVLASAPTDLHVACRSLSTYDDILRARSILKRESESLQNSASSKDESGSTALHNFSTNKALSATLCGRHELEFESTGYLRLQQKSTFDTMEPHSNFSIQVVQFLINDLLASFPPAMMIQNEEGYLPFQNGLVDWVHSSQSNVRCGASDNQYPRSSKISQVWESTSTKFHSAMKLANQTRSVGFETGNSYCDLERGRKLRNDALSSKEEEKFEPDSKTAGICKEKTMPFHVRLSPHSQFSLTMLSAVIDQLDLFNSSRAVPSPRRNGVRSEFNFQSFERARAELKDFRHAFGSVDITSIVVEAVASIPGLMETILLIEDDDDREFVLSQTITQRVMSSRLSMGVWLTRMLQSRDNQISERAVDYIKRVSIQCSDRKCSLDGFKESQHQDPPGCGPMIDEVSNLQDFIPSLLALGDRGMEEASTTLIVKGVLDRMISKPFAGTVVLCDVTFLTLMIVGFRSAVNTMISGDSLAVVLRWIYVANIGIFYFIIREIGKIFSLLSISKRARMYFLSFWNLIDFLATILALASTVSMRWHFAVNDRGVDDLSMLRGLLAVTTGFLWIRVLSVLKAINMQLATFVLAIIQITKDIIWFCVILLILVVSFSQMFFTLLAPSSCASEGSESMQCNQGEYLLRVYTILLGDFGNFELERFQSGFSVFLLVLYSFLVTVVLLNVLIAIASDSYEKCLLRSQHLFGRARIMLVAELVSFQNLLRRSEQSEEGVYSAWWTTSALVQNWSRSSVLFFCVSASVMVTWTLAELLGYSRGERHGNILFSLASVAVNVILFIMIMMFLANGASLRADKVDADSDESNSPDSFLQRAMLRLLGASRNPSLEADFKRNDINDWSGRVHFLQQEMSKIAKEQTSLSMEHAKTMENLISLTESRLRMEINDLHEHFGSLVKERVSGTDRRKYSC